MPKRFPPEFKRDVVSVARRPDSVLAEVCVDFDISKSTLQRWMAQADIEDGVKHGVTSAEQDELVALRRRTRRLETDLQPPAPSTRTRQTDPRRVRTRPQHEQRTRRLIPHPPSTEVWAAPIEVLVLSGSPGSGKTTLANKISELLTSRDVSHAVIDVDELARIHPELERSPKWTNLAAIWPNYAAIPGLGKVILPVLIDTPEDLDQLHAAVARAPLDLVELTAKETTLVERVTTREPNDYWRSKLQGLVERYVERTDNLKFGDFKVDTEKQSPEQSAQAVVDHLGWLE